MKADPREGVAPESWQIKIRRASTVWRPTEDLRNPLSKPLSSWALEVVSLLRQEEPGEDLGTASGADGGRQMFVLRW